MDVVASKRVRSIGAYAFAAVDEKVAELKAQGITPIDFGVGDYNEPTPAFIREACKSAIDERASYGYPSYIGDVSFRNAVSEWMKKRFGVEIDPATEVASTIGSKEGVFNFHEGFVDPGDIVLIPSPGYPPYKRGTLFAEGTAYFYPVTEANGFAPNLDAIPEDIAHRAKVMWICNPHSPTGTVLSPSQLSRIVNFCQANNIILASDEAYSELYFGEEAPHSVLEYGRDGVVACFSMSKRSIMTGWRCGWYAGDRRVIDIFKKVKTNIDSGTPTFIQDASVAALKDEEHVEKLRVETKQKRDIICGALREAGLPDCAPEASLYVWQKAPAGMSG
ncbi:MAG: aminotransferase class I/II-fold pyridoxal phosphate-dependent enzyme, partial [Planctomycetes bacterium]|nr:aminotransferase class I/II-fold pyridoxal phosphate-dependent enzyme [Planctomycetota bacterium]